MEAKSQSIGRNKQQVFVFSQNITEVKINFFFFFFQVFLHRCTMIWPDLISFICNLTCRGEEKRTKKVNVTLLCFSLPRIFYLWLLKKGRVWNLILCAKKFNPFISKTKYERLEKFQPQMKRARKITKE